MWLFKVKAGWFPLGPWKKVLVWNVPKLGNGKGAPVWKKRRVCYFTHFAYLFWKLAWTLRFGAKQPAVFKSGPVLTAVPKVRSQSWKLRFETASRQEARAIIFRKPCKTQWFETAFEMKSRLSDLKTAKPQKTKNCKKNLVFYHTSQN